jgi:hypothetical protein
MLRKVEQFKNIYIVSHKMYVKISIVFSYDQEYAYNIKVVSYRASQEIS